MRQGVLAALALAATSATSGCAGSGLWSSAGDWSAYRATRVAPTFELRLAAAERYLKERPDGHFREEVRAYFFPAEELFYSSKKDSRTGLEAYLTALPQGPHKDQVARRIGELDTAAKSRSAELERTRADVEARVAGPGAAMRSRVRKALDDWLARFLDAEVFRAPLSAAKAELVIPFSLSLPSPRCALLEPPDGATARRCAKLLELPYEVEGSSGFEPREATLEVTLRQDAFGAPLEVTLGGPDLFLRLEETYRIKPIAPDDPGQRAVATARAAAFVGKTFAHVVSDAASCTRPAQPPAALRLACEGVQVEVFPAPAPGEDDTIVIVPLATPAGAPPPLPPR
jgi:hypothetical protein